MADASSIFINVKIISDRQDSPEDWLMRASLRSRPGGKKTVHWGGTPYAASWDRHKLQCNPRLVAITEKLADHLDVLNLFEGSLRRRNMLGNERFAIRDHTFVRWRNLILSTFFSSAAVEKSHHVVIPHRW